MRRTIKESLRVGQFVQLRAYGIPCTHDNTKSSRQGKLNYTLEERQDYLVARAFKGHLDFFFLFGFFETGFLCGIVLTVLELILDQADLELTEIHLHLPLECWD